MLTYIIIVLSIWVLIGAIRLIATPITRYNEGNNAGVVIALTLVEFFSLSIKVLALVFAILLI